MQQIVEPRTGVTDGAGWCHRMARAVFGAPLVYGLDSATKAANATKFRHATRDMPDVAVLVWFDHWGDYDGTGVKNWGHVVVWVPGRGFLTSPWHIKYGQEWYSTLEEIERTFGAKFRFWSEDINGLRVAEPAQTSPTGQEEEELMAEPIYIRDKALGSNGAIYALSPITGKKRHLPSSEWTAVLTASKVTGINAAIVDINAKDIAGIPNA